MITFKNFRKRIMDNYIIRPDNLENLQNAASSSYVEAYFALCYNRKLVLKSHPVGKYLKNNLK